MNECEHENALVIEDSELHINYKGCVFYFCTDCGNFLTDEGVLCGDPTQTTTEIQAESRLQDYHQVQLAGLSDGGADMAPTTEHQVVLPADTPGNHKNRKSKESEAQGTGETRVLEGPWNKTECMNAYRGCQGQMLAFYSMEMKQGNTYFYKCRVCNVRTTISFQDCTYKE